MAIEPYPGITFDPAIRFGKPCIAGTRLDVATVLGALAAGETFEAVAADYQITRKQILDALGYAAHLASHLPPAVPKAS
jgi:uncharacterized protein (DUF433 family)